MDKTHNLMLGKRKNCDAINLKILCLILKYIQIQRKTGPIWITCLSYIENGRCMTSFKFALWRYCFSQPKQYNLLKWRLNTPLFFVTYWLLFGFRSRGRKPSDPTLAPHQPKLITLFYLLLIIDRPKPDGLRNWF